MGEKKGNLHCSRRTNPRGVPVTLQGIRRERSGQVPPQKRGGPRHQPKRRRPSSLRLQNLPAITQPGHRTNQFPGRTPPQGIHPRIEIPIRGPLLFYQKERRKTPTRPRLPKTKRTNDPRQLPAPPDQNDPGTAPRPIPFYQIQHTMGVQ